MATTAAQVCNLALGLVGQRQFIDDLDEATTEAQVCKVFYDDTRRELLQAFAWRFAMSPFIALGELSDTVQDWDYVYQAPSDMLPEGAAVIWSGNRVEGEGDRVAFKQAMLTGSRPVILTDMEGAYLSYTVDIDKPALWPPLFTKAVAAQLAVYLAGALPVKPQLIPMLEQRAMQAFLAAAARSGNAAVPDAPADSALITARD